MSPVKPIEKMPINKTKLAMPVWRDFFEILTGAKIDF
jgi:hypothetical protein